MTVTVCLAGFVAVSVSGCDLMQNQLKIDRSSHAETQDYRDALASRVGQEGQDGAEAAGGDSAGIPDFQSYVAGPADNLRPMPLVSVSVNQTVPLRDILFDVAEQAHYDVELDPRITGSIIFTARDRPFDEVIGRIADMSGLRYKFEEDTVRIELDMPYQKTYKIDYLSYIRKNKSSIKNNVAVATGDGASTGSAFEATSASEADFWQELDSNLKQMLGVAPGQGQLVTAADPQITAVEQNPAPVEPVIAPAPEGATAIGPDGAPLPATVQVQAPQAVLQVQPLPPVAPGGSTGTGAAAAVQTSFAVNRQAGIIGVYASERQHKQVAAYLSEVRKATTAQVLIEAKVMEVSLTDEFSAGIEWDLLNMGDLEMGFGNNVALGRPNLVPETPIVNFSLGTFGSDFAAGVDAISRFGTVHALASPRLTVLNNQSAVLNVATNQVYFEIDIDVTNSDEGTLQTTIDSDIRNVPEGILINVQPSIDLDNNTISMAVRPTVTRIVDYVEDPGVSFAVALAGLDEAVTSEVPVVNVQELDSVIKVGSGQAIVMGGLMQDRTNSTQSGIPVLSEIPLLGSAFRSQADKISKTELVIFLKATIIDADGKTITDIDSDLYRKFSQDRRPLKI